MSASVVTNAGPLLVCAKLNVLPLLTQLYQQVQIPAEVYAETVTVGLRCGYADARTLRLFLEQQQWQPIPVRDIPPNILSANLDRGEQEAIALALEQHSLLLMDEEHGRAIARQEGLTVRGSLGILIAAYRQRLITQDELRLYFSEISERSDIWISPTLCRRLLKEVEMADGA